MGNVLPDRLKCIHSATKFIAGLSRRILGFWGLYSRLGPGSTIGLVGLRVQGKAAASATRLRGSSVNGKGTLVPYYFGVNKATKKRAKEYYWGTSHTLNSHRSLIELFKEQISGTLLES